jgi:hypothetical protein
MKMFNANTIIFVNEQDGVVEREFKHKIIKLLKNHALPVRAYLAQVRYGVRDTSFNVVLCFATSNGSDNVLLKESTKVFKDMFGQYEHLDILFLDTDMEHKLRPVCTPFFVSDEFQFPHPDFYMISDEGYYMHTPRNCYKRKRIYGDHPDGYLLCDISPPIIGQHYGFGGDDITQVIFAHRHVGYSLFPIVEWPAYVRILIPVNESNGFRFIDELKSDEYNFIARGELYQKLEDINLEHYRQR